MKTFPSVCCSRLIFVLRETPSARITLLEQYIVNPYPLRVGARETGPVRVHILMSIAEGPIIDRELDYDHLASHASRKLPLGGLCDTLLTSMYA